MLSRFASTGTRKLYSFYSPLASFIKPTSCRDFITGIPHPKIPSMIRPFSSEATKPGTGPETKTAKEPSTKPVKEEPKKGGKREEYDESKLEEDEEPIDYTALRRKSTFWSKLGTFIFFGSIAAYIAAFIMYKKGVSDYGNRID